MRLEGGDTVTTKERLLTLLETRRGSFLSGEEAARELAVSRAAVCKAVKALRQAGYPIDAVTNRGYRLSEQGDVLSAQGIAKYLNPELRPLVEKTLDSTNAAVRRLAEQGAPEGTVVLAGSQTQGRGRYGRTFYSPEDTGVYLSLLLRPAGDPQQTVLLTAAAAAAMCQAMEALGVENPGIKWVNDIFLSGRKVCGILCEASFSLETGAPEYVVVGAGINVYAPKGGFPPEIADIAGALWESPMADGKNKLAAEFLNRFWTLYRTGGDFLEDYRRRSLVIGKTVAVMAGGESKPALALDIDDRCRLRVRFANGEERSLSYGEVRVVPAEPDEKQ